MVASSDKSSPNNLFTKDSFSKRKLLCSAVIYGPNASGKTNIIEAVNFIDNFVNNSAERKPDTEIEFRQFLLADNPNNKPSEFEVSFIDQEDNRYQYGFHLDNKKVIKEWLVAYPKGLPQTWFEREHLGSLGSKPKYYFGRNLKGKNNQISELTRPDVLFLTNAAKLNHKQLSNVYTWFKDSLRVLNGQDMTPFFFNFTASRAKKDPKIFNKITQFLQIADLGISGFDIHEKIYTEKDFSDDFPAEIKKQFINQKHLEVSLRHNYGENKEVYFPLEEESSGTQNLFALSGPLIDVLENGWVLFVDELDSSLHPLMTRFIVELFHNPKINTKGAQLIFNTHDTTLMDCCIFRRDQIWFVEKDNKGCSHLYSLLEYSPRKNEALAKGYLIGRYGAIPFFGEPQWGNMENAEKQ
jgi:AAA15 family ATPase/GTPase